MTTPAVTETARDSRTATDPNPISARDPRLLTWRALLTTHSRLLDRLDHELRAEAGMSLPEYSALLHLAEAPDRRLRMSQLAEGILLTRSGVTRLIDRLVAVGFVARRQCLSDGRGAEAMLTDAGLEALRIASRTHLRGIKRYFLDPLEPADLEAVGRAMDAVGERVSRAGEPEDG